ncbi:MAG: hypothetical protein HC897_11445 [Thermoanaerobaculia bacterium]|nr:hypothetical protein [Thermoanaerobaculia bacterium]
MSRLGLVFGLCAIVALVPIGSVSHLPMVDLPQHAAQIRLWQHFDEYRASHDLNLFTPYLTVYALGRVLAAVLPIATAMHVLVSLLVLALPASLWFLLARTGGERWWALLGFPLSFSFCFYWGLLNFMAAVPLALVMVSLGLDLARAPDLRRGLILALLGIGLFLTHGLVCALTLAICGALVVALARSPLTAVVTQLPFVPPAVVGVVWFGLTRSKEVQTSKPLSWDFNWQRIVELPGSVLGEAAAGKPRCSRSRWWCWFCFREEKPMHRHANGGRVGFLLFSPRVRTFLAPTFIFGRRFSTSVSRSSSCRSCFWPSPREVGECRSPRSRWPGRSTCCRIFSPSIVRPAGSKI